MGAKGEGLLTSGSETHRQSANHTVGHRAAEKRKRGAQRYNKDPIPQL